MSSNELEAETLKMLGALGAHLENVSERISELREELIRSTEVATEHRGQVLSRVDAVEERLSNLEHSVTRLGKELDEEISPTVTRVRQWEQRGAGFLAAAGMVGTALGALLTLYFSKYQ